MTRPDYAQVPLSGDATLTGSYRSDRADLLTLLNMFNTLKANHKNNTLASTIEIEPTICSTDVNPSDIDRQAETREDPTEIAGVSSVVCFSIDRLNPPFPDF